MGEARCARGLKKVCEVCGEKMWGGKLWGEKMWEEKMWG